MTKSIARLHLLYNYSKTLWKYNNVRRFSRKRASRFILSDYFFLLVFFFLHVCCTVSHDMEDLLVFIICMTDYYHTVFEASVFLVTQVLVGAEHKPSQRNNLNWTDIISSWLFTSPIEEFHLGLQRNNSSQRPERDLEPGHSGFHEVKRPNCSATS